MYDLQTLLKQMANYWQICECLRMEDVSLDDVKEYLMKDCKKPESTARGNITSAKECDLFCSYEDSMSIDGFAADEIRDGMKNFVFSQAKGGVYNPASINRAIDRIIRAYNEEETVNARWEKRMPVLLPHFSAHHLRHTFCTRICMTDLSLKEIQDIMGHADINTTANIYAEVHPEIKKKALKKMQGNIIIK